MVVAVSEILDGGTAAVDAVARLIVEEAAGLLGLVLDAGVMASAAQRKA